MAALDNLTSAVILIIIAIILYFFGTAFAGAMADLFGVVGSAVAWLLVFLVMVGIIRHYW
ncbi:MAG: hypothetical protein HYY37_03690 [Candidatus Aenigmarchaeota archaeon]|nr:hypothetical protein [Candidatus Aenigmarchaeota archaeon]